MRFLLNFSIKAISSMNESVFLKIFTKKPNNTSSVADPGCLSWIPDPNFYPSRILDLGSRIQKQQQKRGVKKICCRTIFCSHKFHKIENYFIFEMLKKIIWANFQRIIELFTQKIVHKLSKIWGWDPGSEKNLSRIPDPGVKKAPDPESRIRNTEYKVIRDLGLNLQNETKRKKFNSLNKNDFYKEFTLNQGI
jgi:hypothetical protein